MSSKSLPPSLIHLKGCHEGQIIDGWTCMVAPTDDAPFAVIEDWTSKTGELVLYRIDGDVIALSKTCESTTPDPKNLYLGFTYEEVFQHFGDLLAKELLKDGDPDSKKVKSAIPPIHDASTYTFVGTPGSYDKVLVDYGGRTPTFDAKPYEPRLGELRKNHLVSEGLIGGWLPILRFVYDLSPTEWLEYAILAPFTDEGESDRVQRVWYRIVRVNDGKLQDVQVFDSYHPFPPRIKSEPFDFYLRLGQMVDAWKAQMSGAMTVEIPDQPLADLARHSIVRSMITRTGDFPHYGVAERNYGGSEHDGFQDTFNADMTALLDWGLVDRAGKIFDNYFAHFVEDDGAIRYRGPQTGQYGRMLTVAAQYGLASGDYALIHKHFKKLAAIVRLLRSMRQQGLELPKSDSRYGLIKGWSEADACLEDDPFRYHDYYFSNTAEAIRGFRSIAEAMEKHGDPTLTDWWKGLKADADDMDACLQQAIAKSVIRSCEPPCLPAIAGTGQPYHVAVKNDPLDPQFRGYRCFMEMFFSGCISREHIQMVHNYRSHYQDMVAGVPTAYGINTMEIAGFLAYGYGFGLLHRGMVPEFLLLTESIRWHQYSRGTWTAPETRLVREGRSPGYCPPAQLVIPMFLRWMLLLEEPFEPVVHLFKGVPTVWFESNSPVRFTGAITRFGSWSAEVVPLPDKRGVKYSITPPPKYNGKIALHLRLPKSWGQLSQNPLEFVSTGRLIEGEVTV